MNPSADNDSIPALQERIAALETELEDAARHFLKYEEEQQRELDELHQLLRQDSPLAARARVSLEETRYELQGVEQRLHALNTLYASLANSASWRYTKPLRALARLLHGDRELFADGLWNQVRPFAEQLPRQRLRSADKVSYSLIGSLAPFLKSSKGYRRWHQAYLSALPPQSAGAALNADNYLGEIAKLKFPAAAEPVISVIISAHGSLQCSLSALRSLSVFPPTVPFEVILTRTSPGDKDLDSLRAVPNLCYIEHAEDIGYQRSCNRAAQSARGRYLFLMHHDVEVTSGALDELLQVFTEHRGAGMVGAKLVDAAGRLQQAGGIVWQDGTTHSFGRLDDPARAAYNVLRETDFCSGAAIMVTRALFESLGGLSEYDQPDGYEDVDLAFRVRHAGQKVFYQPTSIVIQRDGPLCGSETSAAAKGALTNNQEAFRERWAEVLDREHFPPGTELFQAKDRSARKPCLLVIDESIPAADQDAGSRSLTQFMKAFLQMGLNVKFWPQDGNDDPQYVRQLQQAGIEVMLEGPGPDDFAKWYRDNTKFIDHVLLSRPHVSVAFMPVLKASGHAQILFYGHDIHYLRIAMQIEAGVADANASRSLEFFKKLEPNLWPQMDVVYYPSHSETEVVRATLAASGAGTRARTVPVYAFDSFPAIEADLSARSGLLFVAGFRHAPNADGVAWFKQDILPLILKRLPDTHLTIVGSNPTAAVQALADRTTTVTGFISDEALARAYGSCRVCIAPLRFGAGMKGKVAEALRFGVPMVTTPVGLQGLDGASEAVAVASDAQVFADHVVSLLSDDELWRQRSASGQAFARHHLSTECLQKIFALDVKGQG